MCSKSYSFDPKSVHCKTCQTRQKLDIHGNKDKRIYGSKMLFIKKKSDFYFRGGQKCLYQTDAVGNEVPDVTSKMPGQMYDVDEQCRQIYGPSSYLCRVGCQRGVPSRPPAFAVVVARERCSQ